MNTEHTKSMTVVSKRLKATLETISAVASDTPQRLYADLETQNITPAGPMIFSYSGMDGDPTTVFDVEIALPVSDGAASDYAGAFGVSALKPFDYVERVYTGPVDRMGEEGYEPLYIDISKAGLSVTGDAREVYYHWVDPGSEDNKTGIHVGVVR